jgi:uncharacterized membrane-anchored protein
MTPATTNQQILAGISKVPAVTIGFWIVKIMSTTVGETGADYLAVDAGFGAGRTTIAMSILLVIALAAQLRSRRYVPWLYWLCVGLVSVVGTQITDALTDGLGVSLYVSTAVFATVLAVILALWYSLEKSLSIDGIYRGRRECFYWAAILATFALGTAAGDLATEALGLGFSLGAIAFGVLIGVTAMAGTLGGNKVWVFWIAYILTRPLGASLGDLLSQARQYGGFGLGAELTSVCFLIVIFVLVAVEQRRTSVSPDPFRRVQ